MFDISFVTNNDCIYKSLFIDYVVNFKLTLYEFKVNNKSNLNYNSRCIKRDILFMFINTIKLIDIIVFVNENNNLKTFFTFFEFFNNLHVDEHFIINNDLNNNLFVNANNFIFY